MMNPSWTNLSVPQHTPAGKIVGELHYSGIIKALLRHEEFSGYPHNGGEHSFHIKLSAEDTKAFFDLIEEIRTEEGFKYFEQEYFDKGSGLTELKQRAGLA